MVAGIVWKWMYDPVYGALNDLLMKAGLIDSQVEWLSNPKLALLSVIFVNLWRGFLYVTVPGLRKMIVVALALDIVWEVAASASSRS